jgi:putative copper resistance protein D
MTPAEILTGRVLPGEWTWTAAFTTWNIDLIWVLFAVFTSIFYLWGVERLRRRGDSWPIHRPIMWVGAMAILVYTTSGGVAVYGEFLFSAHMIEHMLLTMLIPVGIVLAAPVTLVARAIEVRHDGSRGMREWFLGIIHSKWIGFVGHPLVSTVVFALSLMVFYYSPLLSWASTTHLGHEWMILHFLLAGYLFVQALIGVDPSPHRTSYPVRMILLMGTMGFHAFFGLSLMTGTSLLLPEWFGAMGRTWGDSPLVDQQVGGAIAWGIGELPTLILSAMVVLSWIRSDERDSKRSDRQAARDHDAELEEYNSMLEKLEKRRPTNR